MDKTKSKTFAMEMLGEISDVGLRKVAEDVVFMNLEEVEGDVGAALDRTEPEEVINEGLEKGMKVVSRLYEQGCCQITDLMIAAQVIEKGMKIAEKKMNVERKIRGTVVMHVAENDQHDIGKNIAAVLLRSNGFKVVDMGRDVQVDDMVKVTLEKKPDMITGTALMTTTMSAFPKIAQRLIENGIEIPFICAGGAVNRAFVESYPLGIYAKKASEGPQLAIMAIEGWGWKKMRGLWEDKKSGAVRPKLSDVAAPKDIGVMRGMETTSFLEKPPVPVQRYVQGEVYDNSDKDNPKKLKQVLHAGRENLLKVWIGELEEGAISAPTPINMSALPDLPSWDLQVYFWELNHVPQVQIGELTVFKEPLPGQLNNTCEFSFIPRADQPDFKGQLAVIYQNNVLQMLFLKCKVLADPATAEQDDQIRFELAEVRGLGNVDQLQKFDLSLYNESDPKHGPGLMFFGKQAGLKQISGLQQGIQDFITILRETGRPGPATATLESQKDALVRLANQGSLLYNAILEQIGIDSNALLNLRDVKRLQLVSAVRDVFPLELVYIYSAPGQDAILCPNAEHAILNGECINCERLSEEDAEKLVCPLGFLGMRCTIERHAIQPLQKTDVIMEGKDYQMRVGMTAGGKKISPLKSILFATSGEVTADNLQILTSSLQALSPGKLEYAQNWSEWKEKIKLSPTILILIPHHFKSDTIPSLEIGRTNLWDSSIKEPFVRTLPNVRPLVLLIGCQTAVPDAPYQGFASAFSKAGAAITVMTLSPIHESHAVPITEILISQFKRSALSEQSFGDALLQARRTAMAAGYAEVLTLVADGDADWILTKEV